MWNNKFKGRKLHKYFKMLGIQGVDTFKVYLKSVVTKKIFKNLNVHQRLHAIFRIRT